jgi:hypothetical protein
VASDAAAAAQRTAGRLMGDKLVAYSAARREAESKAEVYRVELDALKAAAPELHLAADGAAAANGGGSRGGTSHVISHFAVKTTN